MNYINFSALDETTPFQSFNNMLNKLYWVNHESFHQGISKARRWVPKMILILAPLQQPKMMRTLGRIRPKINEDRRFRIEISEETGKRPSLRTYKFFPPALALGLEKIGKEDSKGFKKIQTFCPKTLQLMKIRVRDVYDPETKQALNQWELPNSLRPKKLSLPFLMFVELCMGNLLLLSRLLTSTSICKF